MKRSSAALFVRDWLRIGRKLEESNDAHTWTGITGPSQSPDSGTAMPGCSFWDSLPEPTDRTGPGVRLLAMAREISCIQCCTRRDLPLSQWQSVATTACA